MREANLLIRNGRSCGRARIFTPPHPGAPFPHGTTGQEWQQARRALSAQRSPPRLPSLHRGPSLALLLSPPAPPAAPTPPPPPKPRGFLVPGSCGELSCLSGHVPPFPGSGPGCSLHRPFLSPSLRPFEGKRPFNACTAAPVKVSFSLRYTWCLFTTAIERDPLGACVFCEN